MSTNTTPRSLDLRLLCDQLDLTFTGKIIGSGDNPEAVRRNFYSKAIAAYFLHCEAGATVDDAVAASIDGGGDNGIDSIYIGLDNTLWLIQSKYIHAGVGEPDLGDVSKFARNGVNDLLSGHYERFGSTLSGMLRSRIIHTLNKGERRVRAVLVHTGGAINDDRKRIFGDVERSFNNTEPDFLSFQSCGLSTLHDLHTEQFIQPPINEHGFRIYDFGCLTSPYIAYYGKVKAKDLCRLGRTYKDALVEKNIRLFKGSTIVNQGIKETLQNQHNNFFYYNNGVTFLCDSIREAHPQDPNRREGKFNITGLSVINGAQTVGTIAAFDESHYDTYPAEVFATFICLDQSADNFSQQVTQFRNLQNAVDLQDFSALDEKQYDWQATLKLANLEYIVKKGVNDLHISATTMTLRDAAIFLACYETGRDWPHFIKAAKSDRARLFKKPAIRQRQGDVLADAYNRIFRDSLTAHLLWRVSQIGRIVSETVRARASSESDSTALGAEYLRSKEILREGVWFILHLVFVRDSALPLAEELHLTPDQQHTLSIMIDELCLKVIQAAQSQVWNKQASSLFENINDCKTLKGLVMRSFAPVTQV